MGFMGWHEILLNLFQVTMKTVVYWIKKAVKFFTLIWVIRQDGPSSDIWNKKDVYLSWGPAGVRFPLYRQLQFSLILRF